MAESTSDRAVALQTDCRTITKSRNVDEARSSHTEQNVERVGHQIPATIAWTRTGHAPHRLAGISAHRLSLCGRRPRSGSPRPAFQKAARSTRPGGRIAQANKIFLAGNGYEHDPNFPRDLLPDELRHRPFRRCRPALPPAQLHVLPHAPRRLGPLSRRLRSRGGFPGGRNLPSAGSRPWPRRRSSIPNSARCLAMRGAEVIVHSTCEVGQPAAHPKGHRPKGPRHREPGLRCFLPTRPKMEGFDLPAASADGGSMHRRFARSSVLAEAGHGESMVAYAEIDLDALRRYPPPSRDGEPACPGSASRSTPRATGSTATTPRTLWWRGSGGSSTSPRPRRR